ncbi:sensor histidine kinase [Schumannella luteola]
MENPRWWHIAIAATAVVLIAMVLAADLPVWREVGAIAALAAFVAGWYSIGRLGFQNPGAALVFTAIIIVTTGVAVGFHPFMAILQCIAYPLVWVLSTRTRNAVIGNVALSVAVGIGYWASTRSLPETALTAGLSLAFSLALGLWITDISDRSHERQRLLDELHSTQDRLASVNREAGVASERERLAREIHDTIAQDLTGLVLLAQQARRDLSAGRGAEAAEQLAMIEENARTALAETRALVAASAPVPLSAGGLAEALDRLASRFTRETGIAVTVSGATADLERDAEVVLLRCAQESLANVRKHSGARTATLTLSAREGSVRLVVTDDGHGFDPASRTDGFGLGGMRDRLALVGGALDVSSSDSGTTLIATLPRTVPA